MTSCAPSVSSSLELGTNHLHPRVTDFHPLRHDRLRVQAGRSRRRCVSQAVQRLHGGLPRVASGERRARWGCTNTTARSPTTAASITPRASPPGRISGSTEKVRSQVALAQRVDRARTLLASIEGDLIDFEDAKSLTKNPMSYAGASTSPDTPSGTSRRSPIGCDRPRRC